MILLCGAPVREDVPHDAVVALLGEERENRALSDAPSLQLTYRHAGRRCARRVDALYMSPEDLGLPFTIRRYVLDIIGPGPDDCTAQLQGRPTYKKMRREQ